jgi:iron complex outermembrane receptor protein
MTHRLKWTIRLTLAAAWLTRLAPSAAADPDAGTAGSSSEVVVTGTRVADRARLDTLSPVDVLTNEALASHASTELAQALANSIASLDFPRPSITDGTDHIRPAALRGLSPDQTLVLVNSKRRHASALVNVNGSVGRGSAAVDLDAIPLAAIKSVELLRDGASAEYGSDAIAGVLNLRLRDAHEGGSAELTYGEYDTIVNTERGHRRERDGDTVTVSTWSGLPLGAGGFLTLSAEYRDRDPTSRGDFDDRVTRLPVPEPLRVTSRYGDSDARDASFYANAGAPISAEWDTYGWVGYQKRRAESAAFPRLADNPNNVVSIYPNGFLPIVASDIDDVTAALGIKGDLAGWRSDFSFVYGRNALGYRTENSINGTLGATSPQSFDSGGLAYDQMTFNADLTRRFDWGLEEPANVALGVEARRETYSISAGVPDSYRAGAVPRPGTTPGAQGFPGFQPGNEIGQSRHSFSAYADAESLLTRRLLGSLAVRAERYSDFGSAATGKLSGRYDVAPPFALRATVSTGFRAPSLQQGFFTSTATNFVNGVPVEVGTFPATSAISRALGAKPLTAEKSRNYSLGTVVRFIHFDATVDGYRINIRDRIVLSENLGAGATQADVRALLAPFNVGAARFFINGVDTRTTGVDLVMHYMLPTSVSGQFDFTLAANKNKTEVTRVPSTGVLAALNPAPPLFDRLNRLTLEEGTPDSKVVATLDWKLPVRSGSTGVSLRATRYGEVTEPGLPASAAEDPTLRDLVLDPTWLIDLTLNAAFFHDKFAVAAGADNLFDQYPNRTPIARANPAGGTVNLDPTNALAFSRYSPFGFSGRFLYARATYNW